jgi:protein SCO1/2
VILALLLAFAHADEPLPTALVDVGVDEHLGVPLDGSLVFTDQDGAPFRLGDALSGDRPVLLTLAWYHCPRLCGLVVAGAAAAARDVDPARVRLLTVSFDPDDTPAAAHDARAHALDVLGRDDPWPFLTGRSADIAALADRVGFRYHKDPDTGEYAHPAVMMILTPDGRISRYLYGLTPTSRDLGLALLEAAAGHTRSTVDRFVLSCWSWDPATRRYAPAITAYFRAGGVALCLAMGALIGGLRRREGRR